MEFFIRAGYILLMYTEGTMDDQRYQRRYPVDLGVQLIGDLVDGKGVVVDLSTGGCAIRTAVPMTDTLYLRLLFQPPHEDTLIKVELAAVRWATGQTYGLEFIRMNAEQQKRLRDLLKVIHLAPTC